MFTHMIKSSKQKCFAAAWWPTKESTAGSREKAYPLMFIEGGQITRVRANNLFKLPRS